MYSQWFRAVGIAVGNNKLANQGTQDGVVDWSSGALTDHLTTIKVDHCMYFYVRQAYRKTNKNQTLLSSKPNSVTSTSVEITHELGT